ncbi:MAG: zinc ABC transporter permease [Gammaproteobacteria bacterium]|nr:MAG: zinc ABC transporter permease [Gammaproteobacteria bacterium]
MTLLDFFDPNDFIGQAVWALLFLSLLTAPMGCFMVWRKLSYFGATLAHSALLGAILGLITGIGVLAGVIGFTVVLAVVLSFWLNHRLLAGDTVLGMIAHLSLALGILAVSMMDALRIDLMVYLLGDVLSISRHMFYATVALSLTGLVLTMMYWRGFVNLTIQPDIALVEGYSVQTLELIFTLVLAMTIALGMLSIGVLLIVAMLIIPAATARLFSHSLLQMVGLAWLFSMIAIVSGMLLAYYCNLPAGPLIVVVTGGIFVMVNALRLLW